MKLVLILLALCVIGSVAKGAEPIVVDGRAKAIVVLPAQPSKVVQYAVDEFLYHIEKATGVNLLVVKEGQENDEQTARIYSGPTATSTNAGIDVAALSPDTFVLRTIGDSLCIVGRDSDGAPLNPDTLAGTLFGVYELLEDTIGVRWLWPGELGEHIPAARNINIPDLDKIESPQLIIRRLRSTLKNNLLACPIYTQQFAEEFAHHAQNGMVATDFDSLTAMWATQGPQTYLFARWQSNLGTPVDDVLAEYYAGFGPAAEKVKAYFYFWENYTLGNRERFIEIEKETKANWRTYCRIAHECFTIEAFAKGRLLLHEARVAAAEDSVFVARVEFLEKGLTHAEKSASVCRAIAKCDSDVLREAKRDLRDYRRQIERDNVANLAYCAWIEKKSFSKGK